MLDFLAPLSRPPLDTYAPSQAVRTAEPMPAGVIELEVGGAWRVGDATPLPAGALRWGIVPGLSLDVGSATRTLDERNLLDLHWAPIPALLAFNAGYRPAAHPDFAPTGRVEFGSTLEVALPWLTPRIAPRVYVDPAGTSYSARLAVGAETRLLRAVHFGADLDFPFKTFQPAVSLGARFRAIGNLGGAVFGRLALGSPLEVTAGAIAGLRF